MVAEAARGAVDGVRSIHHFRPSKSHTHRVECTEPGCSEDAMTVARADGSVHQWKRCTIHHKRHIGELRARARGAEWNPYRKIDSDGYVWVWDDDACGWLSEHKKVMETKLGRKLAAGETVYHLNEKRADNRPENLELRVERVTRGRKPKGVQCPHCGRSYG